MEMMNFMKNKNVHSCDSMKTNMRHILELLTLENGPVKEACSVIKVEKMILLSRAKIEKSENSHSHTEIIEIMHEINVLIAPKKA